MSGKKNDSLPGSPTATLQGRQKFVNELTEKYYKADIVPPSTKSQILRAQKFSVIYQFIMTAVIFCYAFLIPVFLPAQANELETESYGGLNLHQWKGRSESYIIVSIVMLLPLLRLTLVAWSGAFYQLGALLILSEILIFTFVCVWWSCGMPALAVIVSSNMLNTLVSQVYWKNQLDDIVKCLMDLIPPVIRDFRKDLTDVSVFKSWKDSTAEWSLLMGFTYAKSLPQLYEERCGIFSQKEDNMSHAQAMQLAYQQALRPEWRLTLWSRAEFELFTITFLGVLEGLCHVFVSNSAFALAGLWMGKVTFENAYKWYYGVFFGCVFIAMYFGFLGRTLKRLEEALGVAVAEKEWLAHDVVRHDGERQMVSIDTSVVEDSMAALPSEGSVGFMEVSSADAQNLDFMSSGHLNLVHMWLCVGAIADFIGESYLSRVFWNLSVESRYMVEALTAYDFRLYYHAKWEVLHMGTFLRLVELLVFVICTSMYFGTYFPILWLPKSFVTLLGLAIFLSSLLRFMEGIQFVFSVLSRGRETVRATFVTEWILLVAVMFLFVNIVLWLYLLPIIKQWNLPLGGCDWSINRELFPQACVQYWS